ncbi:putative ATPase, AAA_5 [Gottschalkia acidurici 9a]|uniref:ATPase, AAA_5 n=1 Tax=Gottschalkia acidurici (strain ATCC 7906 / DSM 604 / BCRC 14475 / CIP 104303 / KCTC 5404 / NCIMB 10678 / 9a) TaxID=1128398 RepID=K0AUY2_GOTA9|nr:AAA family ATPase [Gottschalkia acidurici]AFS77683.1 putative ATPase, AAA_5 [Gottschalkia acidurici 9a]
MKNTGVKIQSTNTGLMEKSLDYIWELNKSLPKEKKKAVLIIGAPGIGKSQIAQSVAKKKGCKFIDFRLLTMSETELKGIPFPSEDNKKAVFLHPDIFPDAERDGEEGILLLEELTSANRNLMSTMYQLVLDRELGTYKLPDGWLVVATGNREEDYGEFYVMPAPLADRFLIYELANSGSEFLDEWVGWAYKNNISVEIIAYVRKFPKSLHDFDPDLYEEGMIIFPTPRSWAALSDIIEFDKKRGGEKELSEEAKGMVLSAVGPIHGNQFINFYHCRNNLPNVDDILNGRPYAPITSDQENELALTIASLIDLAKDQFMGETVGPKGKEYMLNIVKFLNNVAEKIGLEYFVLGIHQITSINKELINRLIFTEMDLPEFDEIITKYAHLLH